MNQSQTGERFFYYVTNIILLFFRKFDVKILMEIKKHSVIDCCIQLYEMICLLKFLEPAFSHPTILYNKGNLLY